MPDDPTPTPHDLFVRSRRVVTPDGERDAAVQIRQGRIVALLDPAATPRGAHLDDWGHVALLPGFVDPHVHINEPGRTDWEGFDHATAAAAAAGVTTLIDMPLNSTPVTTTAGALGAKRDAAKGRVRVDVGFYAGLVAGNAGELPGLLDAGARGVKAFLCPSGIDDFPPAGRDDLLPAMRLLAGRGLPLLAHAELVSPAPAMADPRRYSDYLATRPPRFERDAIALLLGLCRETGCRTHIVHLADAGSLDALRGAKQEGLPVTVETCPHYLTFASEEIADGATLWKCAPPIRDAANREGLWRGLAEGVIDFVASDHSPCPPALKQLDTGRFDLAWGGISSLQLSPSVVWTGAAARGHTLVELARWLASAPGDLVGLASGITPGAVAHLVAFDADAEFTVDAAALASRWPITPYDGMRLHGVVRKTYLRGDDPGPGKGQLL